MSIQLVKPSALGYLNQWHRTDKKFMSELRAKDDPLLLGDAFRKLAVKYVVVRCFSTKEIKKTHGQKGIDRCWHKVADAVCSTEINKRSSPTKEVHALADRLGKIFPTGAEPTKANATLLSAASKFLWFRGHTSIRIYDKRAVDALNKLQRMRAHAEGGREWRVNGDYEAFSRAWNQEFSDRKSQLDSAMYELEEQLDWSIIPEGAERKMALRVIGTEWFRDRVFDKFLWTVGEGKTGGKDNFE